MTTVDDLTRFEIRRRRQERVDARLGVIQERRHRLYVLQAGGVRPAALRPLKADLRAARRRLAETVAPRPSQT
jgi:putative ubiquitin-RnfH superfamily antitoxin RatB of RatAB toxin-antitoxin module